MAKRGASRRSIGLVAVLIAVIAVVVGSRSHGGGRTSRAEDSSTSSAPAPAGGVPGSPAVTAGVTAAAPSTAATAAAAGCRLRYEGGYALPDPVCTPGSANPAVTESDIATTICSTGWTATVRPPEAYTENLKRRGLAEYGESGSIRVYEEDHLIPLELGGSPASPTNLWPEPGPSPNAKDRVESAGRRAVCSHGIPLATAQRAIATDWVRFGEQLGVLGPGS